MAKLTDRELSGLVDLVFPELKEGPVAAWDLDSTVRNTSHRRHVAQAIRDKTGEYTWDDYYMLCGKDEPIEGSVALMRELSAAGFSHVAVSGSGSKAHNLTVEWMNDHRVPFNALILRPDGDHSPNGIWKVRVLREMQRKGIDVRLFFEDWGKVAEQVRMETGIPVVGINPFDVEEMASLGQGL